MQGSPRLNLTTKFVNDVHCALTNFGLRNKLIALPQGTRRGSIEFDTNPDLLYDLFLHRSGSLQIGCAPLQLAQESERTDAELRRSLIELKARAEAIASEQGIETQRLAIGGIAWKGADGTRSGMRLSSQ